MLRRVASFILIAALFVVVTAAGLHAAAPKIGVAAAVKNDVHRVIGSNTQPLTTGSDVFTNERIRTGEASIAQILFLDKTTLTVGPRAEVTLDSFVYNPAKGTGRVVLNAVQGAFRFVTGSQNPRNYTIRTPVGVLGVRGTIVDIVIEGGQVYVILVEGSLTMTVNGQTYTLTKTGTALVFSADGTVQGPVTWDGTILNTGAELSFPLYGWTFQGEGLNNGLPSNILNGIDQLNASFQHSLTAPTPPQNINNNDNR